MPIRPLTRFAVLYVTVEMFAVLGLVWAVGLSWALVVLAAAFLAGVVLAASQWKDQFGAIRHRRVGAQQAAADGLLVGLGSVLVFLPGVVSTVVGALMLASPTRAAMRPFAAAMLHRGVLRGVNALNLDRFAHRTGRGDYIDGEVIGEPVPHRVGRAAIVRAGI